MNVIQKTAAIGLTLAASACAGVSAPTEQALKKPEAVLLGHGVLGALYQPEQRRPNTDIAVLVMHAEGDYTQFSAGPELAKRGFTVLNANNSASKSGSNDLDFERSLTEIAKAVKYLREREGIRKVVLLGHSGGGAMFAAYQNVAENGPAACNSAEKIAPCSDAVANLPPADGVVLMDANYGLSTMTLLSIDPALSADNAMQRNSALDLFNPANGMGQDGADYPPEFRQRFQQAAAARMNETIARAQARRRAIDAGKGDFADDEPLLFAGANYMGGNNKMFAQDPTMLAHTSQAWPLVHADGSISREVVHSVRSAKNLKPINSRYGMALKTTVKRFLNTFAIRVDEQNYAILPDGFRGIDWDSTQTSPISAAKGIRVPLLTVGFTGNWEFIAAEKIYLNAPSADKAIVFIEGASHMVTPIDGKYGDTVKLTYDQIAAWLNGDGRF